MSDIILFIFDKEILEAMSSEHGVKIGHQSEMAIRSFGRSFQFDSEVSKKNLGSTLAIAYSKEA